MHTDEEETTIFFHFEPLVEEECIFIIKPTLVCTTIRIYEDLELLQKDIAHFLPTAIIGINTVYF